MRPLIIIGLLLSLGEIIHAQKAPFIRIFDSKGHKIAKGRMIEVTDSFLSVQKGDSLRRIYFSQMNILKLRRSLGHTILVSTLITATVGAVAGAATSDPDASFLGYTAGEGMLLGVVLTAPPGVLIGTIIGGTRKRPSFKINQHFESWVKARELLKAFLPENDGNLIK